VDQWGGWPPSLRAYLEINTEEKKRQVAALGVVTISRGCFELCYSNKKTPPYHSNLRFVRFETGGRRCSVRPQAVRRPRLASATARPRESISLCRAGLKVPYWVWKRVQARANPAYVALKGALQLLSKRHK